ncbi:MAG TPA: HAMP domain-containing sensor histidine kinase [Caulobacteraceae bacterium]|jgi:signal transduction histidine kinase|nr:HAMP domain-containing sensor histidine kinase [Caulobacteraceae bacterium]
MRFAATEDLAWRELWRTATFRLTLLYGGLFAAGVVALVALIYISAAGYLTGQMDAIVLGGARGLSQAPAAVLPARIVEAESQDQRGVDYYGLFSSDGIWVAGNVRQLPGNLPVDGKPRELKVRGLEPGARGLAERLPWGEILFVGFDAKVLTGLRRILLGSLIWSGSIIIVVGLGLGALFSLRPLRRIAAVQAACRRVIEGDLTSRLPVSRRRDEIDMLAATVNGMMAEIERLLAEVQSVGDNVAHDLRTPLTRLRARLHRLCEAWEGAPDGKTTVREALAETDALLIRFRALQRIAQIERLKRRAGFGPVRLAEVCEDLVDLFTPVAEDAGIILTSDIQPVAEISADRELLFEALTNLVGNAIKFTPPGGRVRLVLSAQPRGPRLEILDTGPGVAPEEREAVLQRFHRGRGEQGVPGSGLGLSIVAAVARLHDYRLTLDDARPGLRVILDCWPIGLDAEARVA